MEPRLGHEKIAEALALAAEQYGDRIAVGTDMMLLLRATDMLHLMSQVTERTEVLVAAILYDILLETDIDRDEIGERFGAEVLDLILVHNENKEQLWIDREPIPASALGLLSREEQLLIVADIITRERWIARALEKIGDTLWNYLERSRKELAMYYSDVQDALVHLQDDREGAVLGWQMVNEYKDLFVQYWIDEDWTAIYQFAEFGECVMWRRDSLGWSVASLPDTSTMQQITRQEAEFMTDVWNHILTFSADLGPLQ
ncbi:MAG: hypothetical protein IKD85_00200 [Firmicutes bacterium]|nr:hypothetical protein [Bacillota bacterium]